MLWQRHWFYHVHQAEPEVLMRGWSGSPLKLSKTRRSCWTLSNKIWAENPLADHDYSSICHIFVLVEWQFGNITRYAAMPHFQTDPFLEHFATGHVLPCLLNHLKSKGGVTGATSQSLMFFFYSPDVARHYQHCNCEPPTHLVRSQEIARIFFFPLLDQN